MAVRKTANANITKKRKIQTKSGINLKEAIILKNKSVDDTCGSSKNSVGIYEETSRNSKSGNSVRKKYSEKHATMTVEKKQKIEAPSKPGYNSGKCLKKNKINLSKQKKVKLSKKYLLPYANESFSKESSDKEGQINSSTKVLNENGDNTAGAAKKMIFVSLDFLEECQKYKKKLRKQWGIMESKAIRRSIHRIMSRNKPSPIKIQENSAPQNSRRDKKDENKMNYKMTISMVTENGEREMLYKESKDEQKKNSNVANTKITVVSPDAKDLGTDLQTIDEKTEKHLEGWPSFSNEKSSEENISKIDNQYLQSLLLIANIQKPKESKALIKVNENRKEVAKNSTALKGKITGKAFFEGKKRNKKIKENSMKRAAEEVIKTSEIRTEEFEQQSSKKRKNSISKIKHSTEKIVHALTQSESHIDLKKASKLFKDSTKRKVTKNEKKMAISKVEVSNDTTKRKARNSILKNNQNNLLEMPFSCKISKEEDIKELWRRADKKASDTSLSNHSSTTVVEPDQVAQNQHLGIYSYKVLRKIVGDEICRISKNYINVKKEEKVAPKEEDKKCEEKKPEKKKCEDNLKEKEKKGDEILKNKEKDLEKVEKKDIKNFENFLKTLNKTTTFPPIHNFGDFLDGGDEDLDLVVKRRLFKQQNFDNYINFNENGDTNKIYPKIKIEDLKEELKNLGDEKNRKKKDLSQEIENWTIVQRLEKAFIALGGTNFQNKAFNNSSMKSGAKFHNISGGETTEKIKDYHHKRLGEETSYNDNKKLTKDLTKTKLPKRKTDTAFIKKLSDESIIPHKTVKESASNNVTGIKNFNKSSKLQDISKIVDAIPSKKLDNSKRITQKCKELNNKLKQESLSNPNSNIIDNNMAEIEVGKNNRKEKLNSTTVDCTSQLLPNSEPRKKSIHKSDGMSNSKNFKEEANTIKLQSNENIKNNSTIKHETCGETTKTSKVLPRKTHSTNKNEKESLRKKPTSDHNSENNIFIIRPQKSKSCNKNEENVEVQLKNCLSLNDKQNGKTVNKKNTEFWDFIEENEKQCAEEKLKKRGWNNDQSDRASIAFSKKSVKKQNIDKLNISKTSTESNEKTITEKEYTKGNEENLLKIIKAKVNLEKKFKKTPNDIVEKLPEQIHSVKKNASQTISNEREVKERSFLSISQNQPPNLGKIPVQKNLNTILHKNMHDSNFSLLSTRTYEIIEPSLQNNVFDNQLVRNTPTLSNISTLTYDKFLPKTETEKEDTNKKAQPLWEQDIKCYREIVKDIMSQYKRLNGLLKQSKDFASDFLGSPSWSFENESEENSTFSQGSVNIDEYRKKIMSQYEALPILEYKSKIIEKEENKVKEENLKRNLIAVKAISSKMDHDIKDFEPNIPKALDSPLYVDPESLLKGNLTDIKAKNKINSLQNFCCVSKENLSKKVLSDHCQREIRSSKTLGENFLLQQTFKNLERQKDITLNTNPKIENLSNFDINQAESDIFFETLTG